MKVQKFFKMTIQVPAILIILLKKLKIYEFSKKVYRRYFLYSGIIKNDIESVLFYRSYNEKKGLFIDVGCFKGSKIDQFLNINKNLEIIGIEPFKNYFEKLSSKYKNFSNIKIFNYAISDKNNLKSKFFYNKKKVDKEAFSLLKTPKLNKIAYVKTIMLDKFINRKPKIVKIDTEGAELKVINGSKKIIESCRPIFFIEVTHLTLKKIERKLKKKNYMIFVYEYTFFKRNLTNNWVKSNLIQNNIYDLKVFRSEEILMKGRKFMFNLICLPKENKKIIKDLN